MPNQTQTNPGFTHFGGAEASENRRDESGILTDQDQTNIEDALSRDENMGAMSNKLESLEDEPADFMRGEIDVVDQMNRAADAMEASVLGLPSQADEDSPRSEIGASFKDTPGGLEEVEMKTDEDLARRKGHRVDHARHGHETGAYTDIGAGRSGVTRPPSENKQEKH